MADASTSSKDNTNKSTTSASSSDLPQSKHGLGSDHSDLIYLALKYFRIVALVFFVWIFGKLQKRNT